MQTSIEKKVQKFMAAVFVTAKFIHLFVVRFYQ